MVTITQPCMQVNVINKTVPTVYTLSIYAVEIPNVSHAVGYNATEPLVHTDVMQSAILFCFATSVKSVMYKLV